MREILFRGKRTEDGKWIEGCYIEMSYEKYGLDQIETVIGHFILPKNSSEDDIFIEVIPSTIGQFTGLHDRDGKRIFEGDVLFYSASNHSSMEVKFENGCFVGEGPFNTLPLHEYMTASDFEFIEVMGNIHES